MKVHLVWGEKIQHGLRNGCIRSAGCMLFFLLSGRLPFVAATLKERPGRSPNEKERVSKVQEICFTIVSFI